MSTDLIKYINSLPISTYLLSNDRHLIGRKIAEDPTMIYVNAVCTMETIINEDNSVLMMLLPLIPNSFEETTSLYRSHVVLETPASLPLKKSYCDTLLKTKLNSIQSSSSLDLDTNDHNTGSNPFKDRWNN